jgi:hypothetical protein
MAEPQNDMLRYCSWEHWRARTSVAVSERAQQKDYGILVSTLEGMCLEMMASLPGPTLAAA